MNGCVYSPELLICIITKRILPCFKYLVEKFFIAAVLSSKTTSSNDETFQQELYCIEIH